MLYPDRDEELATWVREMRQNKKLVSRRIISDKATSVFRDTDLKVSI